MIVFYSSNLFAQTDSASKKEHQDTLQVVVTNGLEIKRQSQDFKGLFNNLPLQYVSSQPYISLQQLLKGNAAGVYVQEPSGEPGTEQNIFIHGISYPLLNKQALFDQQAAVFVNGIPVALDNPFAYDIQKYDFNRIGPATNLLATIDPANIESIEIVKDPLTLASLGPIAAKGAILVTTKSAHSGYRDINVNTYFGILQKPNITPVNAAYENNFRQPFYNKYSTPLDRLNYPPYLRDSTNSDYYGPANWTDVYFKNAPVYSINLSLSGGSDRANFRFFVGDTKNNGNADNTALDRYTGAFSINVAPLKWLMVSSNITYNRLDRTGNRNIRDRLAEERYLPDLTNPLTPNKNEYNKYLAEFDKSIDKNVTNVIQGYIALAADYKKFHYKSRIGFDYNEGLRDVFFPLTLLENNNFVSTYFGYNQRFILSNSLGYQFNLPNKQKISLEAAQSYMADIYKYDYAYAYNGPNDFIKINVVDGNPGASDYLDPRGFTVYYFPDKMQSNLASFSGNVSYSYNDVLKVSGLVRRDGSSNMQPDNRWFTSFSAGADWDIKKSLLKNAANKISTLSLSTSWARIGKLLSDDRFSAGPQYRVDLGWSGEPTIGSYAGFPGISRPYTGGWVGYGIPWSYSDQLNVGARVGAFNDRLKLDIGFYNRNDKQMLFAIPVPTEWGYTSAYEPGLEVNNKGMDISIATDIIPAKQNKISWTFTANSNFNSNKLIALPGNLQELIVSTTKLTVGQPIDAFWVYKNNGIYNTDAEVPVNPTTNQKLNFQGVALKAGDPRWADMNGDYVINDKDKVSMGHYLPKVTGGFGSTLAYKAFSLNFQFYFALGQKVLNQYAASHLDFINTEANNDINSVKEITFWQKKMDLSSYPKYNPWSPVVPYRLGQDMFIDNASFLKLRTLSVNYDLLKGTSKKWNKSFKSCIVYVTATNLFTITPFKGDDPELSTYNGIYNGYGLPIPRSLIIGLKLNL
ncbi:MAG: SusC/RagA family TonB-linked outer membrane protein [Bacteroidetes bacterium]|nr:SusC/RagA family TonB-linked outer membrane protein [Bacteroidota bacterium]